MLLVEILKCSCRRYFRSVAKFVVIIYSNVVVVCGVVLLWIRFAINAKKVAVVCEYDMCRDVEPTNFCPTKTNVHPPTESKNQARTFTGTNSLLHFVIWCSHVTTILYTIEHFCHHRILQQSVLHHKIYNLRFWF